MDRISNKYKFMHSSLMRVIEEKPDDIQKQIHNQLFKIYSQMLEQLKRVPNTKKESNE